MPSMMTAPGSFRAKKVGRGSDQECGMDEEDATIFNRNEPPKGGGGGGGGGALFRRRVSSAYYTRYHIHVVYLEAF
jgi:hypothetical protein